MGARWYDSQLGRFISPDSIIPNPTDPQNFNRYTFVLNNPVKYTDPSGHCIWDLCILEIAGVSLGAVELTAMGATLYGTYEVVTSDAYQDALKDVIKTFPGQAPTVDPLPGYGEGELALSDPGVYNPGPTLGDVKVPPVLPGPPIAGEQPNTVLDFPSSGIEIPNILEARGPQSTYTMVDPATGQVKYVGRTNNLDRRQNEHARDPGKANLDFVPDKTNLTYEQARGREQLLYDKNVGNDLLNAIKPISDRNPKRDIYLQAGSNIR